MLVSDGPPEVFEFRIVVVVFTHFFVASAGDVPSPARGCPL